ncbi:MAG: 30S ribosomal protein S27ae [Thermoplasmata archaeon]|nr:30S ribosomal protein S27ae [Thermoplasmata archaeon]
MAKARVGLYAIQGETFTRTHRSCPKCGPGVFLAEHANRRSCGRCGFSEPRDTPATPARPPRAGKA